MRAVFGRGRATVIGGEPKVNSAIIQQLIKDNLRL